MAALLLGRRLDGSAVESVDEMAQLEQIGNTAENANGGVVGREISCAASIILVPIGPLARDERAAAVGQGDKQGKDAAAPDAADHDERTTLERVALAGDRHRIGKITVMGILPPLPSTRFRIRT
jgi:hypothetical protein